jgi:ABC-2 type transport system permease protein
VFAMFVNDGMWLTFWYAYFGKFPLVGGWTQKDVVTLWAVVAAGFGLAMTVAGNAQKLAGLIAKGDLDFFLSMPKPVLPHVLMARMDFTAPGDILFGAIAFGALTSPTAAQWGLFVLFAVTTALIWVSFAVVAHSLAFWLGSAEALAAQLLNALVTFSTYPTVIFRGGVKLVLFTILPAGFIAYLPVEALRRVDPKLLGAVVGFAALAVVTSVLIFRRGMRRYESGNLLAFRD